jgi:hypothetical protein
MNLSRTSDLASPHPVENKGPVGIADRVVFKALTTILTA